MHTDSEHISTSSRNANVEQRDRHWWNESIQLIAGHSQFGRRFVSAVDCHPIRGNGRTVSRMAAAAAASASSANCRHEIRSFAWHLTVARMTLRPIPVVKTRIAEPAVEVETECGVKSLETVLSRCRTAPVRYITSAAASAHARCCILIN